MMELSAYENAVKISNVTSKVNIPSPSTLQPFSRLQANNSPVLDRYSNFHDYPSTSHSDGNKEVQTYNLVHKTCTGVVKIERVGLAWFQNCDIPSIDCEKSQCRVCVLPIDHRILRDVDFPTTSRSPPSGFVDIRRTTSRFFPSRPCNTSTNATTRSDSSNENHDDFYYDTSIGTTFSNATPPPPPSWDTYIPHPTISTSPPSLCSTPSADSVLEENLQVQREDRKARADRARRDYALWKEKMHEDHIDNDLSLACQTQTLRFGPVVNTLLSCLDFVEIPKLTLGSPLIPVGYVEGGTFGFARSVSTSGGGLGG